MALPKIQHPVFKVLVPSLEKELKFRPFTVKEEKILLIAQSTENMKDVLDAVLQVINNCAVDDLDVEELTSFDIDYLFIKLRSRSVNNIVKIEYRDPATEEVVPIEVDLDQVNVFHHADHAPLKNILLDDTGTTGLTMRYPKPDIVNRISTTSSEAAVLDIFKYCIDTVYDEETVYHLHDGTQTDDEVNEFIESLSPAALAKIEKFFDTMPRLRHSVKYKTSDGVERELVLQSLSDFFILG